MKALKNIGVIGAGTMGAALAQKFAQEGFAVTLADREMKFVDKGIVGIKNTLQEGVSRKLFTEEQVNNFVNNIHGTCELADLKVCDVVVEAIFEDFDVKSNLYKQLNGILKPEAVLATNTSSFSVTELAKSAPNPANFVGLHYFYHAAKNRLVEIVPGEQTSQETLDKCHQFTFLSGKDPITCKDKNGFVVNRFFVPWLNESVRLLEQGIASPGEIDAVCEKVFKIGMGPFALMNATGVPIAYHAQKTLELFGELYTVSERLKKQALEIGEPWQIDTVDSAIISAEVFAKVRERILGVVFLVCSQILDEQVCSAVALNRGARIGLRWSRGPVELMQASGGEEVKELITHVAGLYQTPVPQAIGQEHWLMDYVTLKTSGSVAVLRIEKPEDMNALNEQVVKQLDEKFSIAETDPTVKTILITGAGKAFVAGADIKFFVDNIRKQSIDRIVEFTTYGQSVFEKIDSSAKQVIALVNGLALGGGLELALCADKIIAVENAVVAFPETSIGIYPGLGGTQRPQKRIGKALTKYLVGTGQMLTEKKAVEMGLFDGVVNRSKAFRILAGELDLATEKPNLRPDVWNEIERYFEQYSFADIVQNKIDPAANDNKTLNRIPGKLASKAPIALKIAEELINNAAGCHAELEQLVTIFSTEDALLGLTSIGRRVEYSGK